MTIILSLIPYIIFFILGLLILYFSIVFLVQIPRALMDIEADLSKISEIMQKQYEKDYNDKIDAEAKNLSKLDSDDME